MLNILFSGTVHRSLKYTLPSIQTNIFAQINDYKVFVSTTDESAINNIRSKENNIPVNVTDCNLLNPYKMTVVKNEIPSSVNWDHLIKIGDPYRSGYKNLRNWVMSLECMRSGLELIDNDDPILFLRADCLYHNPIIIPSLTPFSIFVPDFQHWTGINDRAAYGDHTSMSIYLNQINKINELKKVTTAESYLKTYLTKKNRLKIKYLNILFSRTRADGTHSAHDLNDERLRVYND